MAENVDAKSPRPAREPVMQGENPCLNLFFTCPSLMSGVRLRPRGTVGESVEYAAHVRAPERALLLCNFLSIFYVE